MSERARRLRALCVERLGMGKPLLVLVLLVWIFSTLMLAGIDRALHDTGWPAKRVGIELAVIPLVAVGAARCT